MFSYVIQSGDTLYKIAQRYDVTVQEIIDANPNVNPYNLHVGQIIMVPDNSMMFRQQRTRPADQMPQMLRNPMQ